MGRKQGNITKKDCWNVIVKDYQDNILLNKNYSSLKKASDDLGITYAQIFELSPNGRKKNKKFCKYSPNIIVEKIGAIKQLEVKQGEQILDNDNYTTFEPLST